MSQSKKQSLSNIAVDSFKHGQEIGKNQIAARKKYLEIVSSRIKQLRIENRMTQHEISDKVSINYLTYSGYENQRSQVPIEVLVSLADAYQVSMDYLVGRTENRKGAYIEKAPANAEALEERIAKLEATIGKIRNT